MTAVVTRQRAQWVHDMARARNGLPYAYGGAFTEDPRRSTDCSGLVLQTAAWYMGRTDWSGNRYGSTESFRLDHKIVYDLGFKRMPPGGPAALPFKPVMLVGLMHGGGGENSHTACTLMTMDIPGGPVVQSVRGVDWESHGGGGVDLYDDARAWNDPLFHDFWYLDAKLEDAPTSSEMTVPLTNLGNGRWGSPSPAWDHLIKRESGGNPTIIQQIIDVNSGGNEAEGLFQITPKTWRAHNGTQFAASPRLATPQQQAIVAARIFIRNPSGSDWGAGLPGREDAKQLAAGLVPTDPQGVDDLADPDIQRMIRELHGAMFNRVPSQSIYRDVGEDQNPHWQLHELIKNDDGMLHQRHCEDQARLGNLTELARIVKVAAGQGAVRDQWAVDHAINVLSDIARTNPEVLTRFNAQKGAAV
ncbi:lysin A [Mycobacterium phage SemperFi]|uniref:Lysin A n=1 Tax=Mycobacterium phage Georgie2 TaxID=2743928 RepID=A0A7D5JP49_9CAUD|nr:endolysin [Mycobacterium phage SweetiePie]YP_010063816.1 endolysin [Mycobacterium phage Georgie2]AIS73772.1 lysin A [Mycobacterium phage Power]ATN91854.1 lysin A [Mycobacterium phage SnapTap]AXC33261.1 lysin A [Mycobacterium phage Crucio]AXQ52935.1 lysin A [Mycobacterium phage QueenBeesly]QFG11811.1 lysin A [Mycobacterium phage SemperFi]QKY80074.1 lysin A [Mycobacterium Phage FiringLine]